LNWYLTIFGEVGEPLPDSSPPSTITIAPSSTSLASAPTPRPILTTPIPDKQKHLENLVGGSGALAFFAITGFLGVLAFIYFICYHRKNKTRAAAYSFKELEDEADVFGEYDDEILFDEDDGDGEGNVMLMPMGGSLPGNNV
jgi:hypothetical protein